MILGPRTTSDSGNVAAPKRVLMTGASGFIGEHVVERLLGSGFHVHSLGRRPPRHAHPRLAFRLVSDIREDFADAATGCDCVVHLAGLADASASYERPADYADVNVVGTIRALDAARHANAAFILASSMRVYRPSIRQLSEEAPREPVDPYGLSKLQAEEWTETYARLFGVRSTVLRLFSVYGPGQTSGKGSGVVTIFLETARAGHPLRVRARQLQWSADGRRLLVVNRLLALLYSPSGRVKSLVATTPESPIVTATCGNGCRGTFDGTISAPAGFSGPAVLRLFERSAEDGSELHTVEVPITIGS